MRKGYRRINIKCTYEIQLICKNYDPNKFEIFIEECVKRDVIDLVVPIIVELGTIYDRLEMVKKCIEAFYFDINSYLNHYSGRNRTCLSITVKHGHVDILDYLLTLENLDVNMKVNGKHVIFDVLKGFDHGNKIDIINKLINKGCDVNVTDDVGRTPIFYANTEDEINYLIVGGARLDIIDNYEEDNVLSFMVDQEKSIDLIAKVLDYGCVPILKMITTAVRKNRMDVVKLILPHYIEFPDTHDDILYYAYLNENIEMMQLLITSGIKPVNFQKINILRTCKLKHDKSKIYDAMLQC